MRSLITMHFSPAASVPSPNAKPTSAYSPPCLRPKGKAWTLNNKITVMTRNSELLKDFAAYCEANPTMRFWQALRNWSGFSFIYACPVGEEATIDSALVDTFYLEGKDC